MTSTRVLARNTVLNLAGQAAPLVVALVAVPLLIASLGDARFGVLTIAWALIGYFGLFDLGLGRALTQAASDAIGRGDAVGMRRVSVSGIVASFVLGTVGGIVMAAVTPLLVHGVLKMDPVLRAEAEWSFFLLAASLPFVLSTIAFRGLLEAHQHFGLATALRVPFSLFNFVGPLLVIPFSRSLVPITVILVAGRVLTFVAHLVFCVRRYPWLRTARLPALRETAPLFRLGGWMTVSNVISPLMVYMDRFAIGALLSMAAVAYYVTPFELAIKTLIVPAAVLGVFFPAFASTLVQDRARTATMVDRAGRLMLLAMFPIVLTLVTMARELLHVWVGPEYASQSALILQLLALGVLINTVGQAPFALIQAAGRADITAKLHLAELPAYAAMILVLARGYGLAGVAMAWTARLAIDTALLSWRSVRLLPEMKPAITRLLAWLGCMSAPIVLLMQINGTRWRLMIGLLTMTVFLGLAMTVLLSGPERSMVRDLLRRGRRPAAPA